MPITRRGFLKGLGAVLGGLIAEKVSPAPRAAQAADREDDWCLPEVAEDRSFVDHYETDPIDDDTDSYFFRGSPSVWSGWSGRRRYCSYCNVHQSHNGSHCVSCGAPLP